MNKIEVCCLNPQTIHEAEKMMVFTARLTQRGEKIKSMADFRALFNRHYENGIVEELIKLPHPTIQKFSLITFAIVGASRRFLAQITRHQNEVKFMSASLQYSDYSGEADFVVPYAILEKGELAITDYLKVCRRAMHSYANCVEAGIGNDAAGYMAPQGLRNILIISATPFQWKHMIAQRTCRRNTDETRYVMLRIWQALREASPTMFDNCGPFCMQQGRSCEEGKMGCAKPILKSWTPENILWMDFPILMKT